MRQLRTLTALSLLLAAPAAVVAAPPSGSPAYSHASPNASFNRVGAPAPIAGAGLAAFGIAGAFWLYRRRKKKDHEG